MYDRLAQGASVQLLEEYFQLSPVDWEPRYNLAPNDLLLTVQQRGGERSFLPMTWGFIPDWVRYVPAQKKRPVARIETITHNAYFKGALKAHRCLVPASGFYKWKTRHHPPQPYFVSLKNTPLFAIAGLWSTLKTPRGDEYRVAILTQNAPSSLASLHARIPVVVPPHRLQEWLENKPLNTIQDFRRKEEEEPWFQYWPVTTRVNSLRYNEPDCIAALKVKDE